MTAKRNSKAKTPGILAGRLSLVSIERGGVTIQVGDVPASQSVAVAVAILRALQVHEKEFPSLLPPLDSFQVGGYHPLPVDEEDDGYTRRVGFVTQRT